MAGFDDDLPYLLHRAEREAVIAIAGGDSPGGDAHFELSVRYSSLAVRALGAQRPVKPQPAFVPEP